jgi:hypothetical protein
VRASLTELNGRLARSAPAITPRGDRLHAALDEVVTSSRPRPRRRRWLVGGATVSLVLLGGTSAALASPPVLDWLGFTPDQSLQHTNVDGDLCVAGMIVRPEGVAADDESFRAAREILLAIDFDTLEVPAHIREQQNSGAAAAAAARAEATDLYNLAHPEATFPPAADDSQTDLLLSTAYELMADGVAARGLDPSHFSFEAVGTCDEANR